jgi:hypothetical protein
MTVRGQVLDGVIVLQNGAQLPEGTLVEVTPLPAETAIAPPYPVSAEQREALLGLIGMWKVANPPSDEEVGQIIEDYRMKKYG